MPGKGFSTIGLKPDILARLQSITNTYYPGMFLPSTLIIMMNEVKRGYYSIGFHNIKLNLSGRYSSITIRLDVADWLKENYKEFKEKYEEKYHVKCLSVFTSYFMANLFESKLDAQNYKINLKESDFEWLQEEYVKFKANSNLGNKIPTFDKFADAYLKQLLQKFKSAQDILALTNFVGKLEFEGSQKN